MLDYICQKHNQNMQTFCCLFTHTVARIFVRVPGFFVPLFFSLTGSTLTHQRTAPQTECYQDINRKRRTGNRLLVTPICWEAGIELTRLLCKMVPSPFKLKTLICADSVHSVFLISFFSLVTSSSFILWSHQHRQVCEIEWEIWPCQDGLAIKLHRHCPVSELCRSRHIPRFIHRERTSKITPSVGKAGIKLESVVYGTFTRSGSVCGRRNNCRFRSKH